MRTCGAFIVKDDLCVVWAKIVGFMDNTPWWEIENGHRLVGYNYTRNYETEVSVPIQVNILNSYLLLCTQIITEINAQIFLF